MRRAARTQAAPRSIAVDANEPLALLHFAFRAVTAGPDAELARRGLGRVHHRILFFIARSPKLHVGELIATLGITKQALHGPLRQLIRGALVQSRPDPHNLRERRLALTVTGKALERRLSGHQRRVFGAAFRHAGPAATRGWHAVMRELLVVASKSSNTPS